MVFEIQEIKRKEFSVENIETNEIEQGFDWDATFQALIALGVGALFVAAIAKALSM